MITAPLPARIAALRAEFARPDADVAVLLPKLHALRDIDPAAFDRLFAEAVGAPYEDAPDLSGRRPPNLRQRPAPVPEEEEVTALDFSSPAPAAPKDLPFPVEAGVEWATDACIQVITPRWYCRPDLLAHLRQLVDTARARGRKVRAFGSGHSYSDVALTEDFFVDTSGLNRPLALPPLRAGLSAADFVHVEAGIKLRDLNALLHEQKRAMFNLGGYTGQSIIGAACTGTHGSGIGLGNLASIVASIVLVTERETLRIEPKDGPSEPKGWREPGVDRLVQEDDLFNAVVVGLGCMGLVYSVILRVRPRYLLEEHTTLTTWSKVKADLKSGALFRDAKTGKDHRHVQVTMNPHVTHGDHTALVVVRNEVQGNPEGLITERNWIGQLLTSSKLVQRTLIQTLNLAPHLVPGFWDTTLRSWNTGREVGWSFDVLSSTRKPDGFACENAVPMKDGAHIRAMEEVFRVAGTQVREHGRYMSMVAMRFVKGSSAFLAPQYSADGTPWCHYEILTPTGLEGAPQVFRAVTRALFQHGSRPHWGLEWGVLDGIDRVRAMYPRLDDWLAVYRRLNPDGTFENVFTKRIGISK